MRTRLLLILACLALALDAAAQTKVKILSQSVVPARPYVGDVVESTIVFDPGDLVPETGPLTVPQLHAKDADAELVSAAISRKGSQWVYSARFIPWKTGSVRIPLVKLAGLAFPEAMVEIASVVDDFGRDPPRYKDPLELRGTRLLVWGVSGALLLAVVLAWTTGFWILPWIRRVRKTWREGQPARDFGRSLDYLEKTCASLNADALWALLAKGLRNYLSARTAIPYRAYTASEACAVPVEDLPDGVAEQVAALLAQGDEVRFARKTSVPDARGAIARSRAILARVEEAARDSVR